MNNGKKNFTVKARILLIALLPSLVISIALLITGVLFMKNGMEEEILKGLLSSAYAYRDTGINNMDREPGDSKIEETLKTQTGFDFTWFDKDTRKNSSLGSSVIGTKAADTVISEVIKGKNTFTSVNTQVAGKAYFVAYVPVKDDSGNVIAMSFTGVSREAVESKINKSISSMVIITLLLLVITFFVSLSSASRMAGAVKAIEDSVTNMANGNFVSSTTHLGRTDEIGVALNSTNALVEKLKKVVVSIRGAAETVGKKASELADTSFNINNNTEGVSNAIQDVANGATDQAGTVQNAKYDTDKLSSAIQSVANEANQLANTASQMDKDSKNSAEALSELSSKMTSMEKSVKSITDSMESTNSAVLTVNEKVAGITSIASQTNLLALNASIEAARAGESGKGFAVVASEIGQLATSSATTAKEIQQEMANLLNQSNNAKVKTEEISEICKNVADVLTETINQINSLIENVNSTVSGVSKITVLAKDCDSSKEVIIDAMNSLSAISEENAASSEETSATMIELSNSVSTLADSASELKDVARKLDVELQFFNI